jgi:hypothetical protein
MMPKEHKDGLDSVNKISRSSYRSVALSIKKTGLLMVTKTLFSTKMLRELRSTTVSIQRIKLYLPKLLQLSRL